MKFLTRRVGRIAALCAATAATIIGAPASLSADQRMQAPDRQADDDTVIVAWAGDLNSFDPPDSLVEFNREASLALYDTLLSYELTEQDDGRLVWEGLEVAPGLAEHWEIDGATVTFTLREGVTFNVTGNPLTADDVKYSFVRSIEVPGFGRFNSNLAGLFEPDRQIEVIDDRTVAFTFERADGTAQLLTASLPSLRFPTFGIVDKVEVESHATADDPWGHLWLKDNPAGTGPYVLASRTPGTETVLDAAEDHWEGLDGFDTVIFRTLGGPADIVSLMLGGEVDITGSLPDRELRALADAGLSVPNAAIPDIWRLDLPVDVPPLDNQAIRQAIAHALPYQTLLDEVFVGAERAYSYVNPAAPDFAPSWNIYDTDLDTARELVESSGVTDLSVDLYYDTGSPTWEYVALYIQANLSQIGIDVTLVPLPATAFAEQTTARVNGESVMNGMALRRTTIWLDDAAANTALWIYSGGTSNATRYARDDLDQLYLDNRFEPDVAVRLEAFTIVQDTAAEDAPLIPLVVRGKPIAVHPSISGVAFTADPHIRVRYLHLAEG